MGGGTEEQEDVSLYNVEPRQDCPYCGWWHAVRDDQKPFYYCLACGCPLSDPIVKIMYNWKSEWPKFVESSDITRPADPTGRVQRIRGELP